ncbi:MAG TPA: PEP-CTERM sorting domain-containing protein [Gemmatimonadaceae bacterium]
MGVRGIARAALIGSAALALGSIPAAAQTVTFSTTGAFSGACTGTSCGFGGFTLSFVPVASNSFFSGSLVDLGTFNSSCSLSSCPLTNFPSGVTFTLTINQTNPSSGTNNFAGTISGQLAFNPTFSSLIWTPTPNTFNIGVANYALVVDNTGHFNIEAPTGDNNPNATVVKAFVSTVPEPSTVALMATGMFGLIPVVRRRRK